MQTTSRWVPRMVRQSEFIARWPAAPKIAFLAPPNAPKFELTQRLGVDLGVPVLSIKEMLDRVQVAAGTDEEFSHPFYQRVKAMLDEGDRDGIRDEKIVQKLIRITDVAQDGFILTDFPHTLQDAESLEELKGGMNSFVHLNVPERFLAQLEENKFQCADCGTTYYGTQVEDREFGITQDESLPDDGNCLNCGSHQIVSATDPEKFESDLNAYNKIKDELLGFYDHHGLLADIDLKKGGLGDYENVRRQIQYQIKF